MFKGVFAFLLLTFCGSAFATDIDPTQKLGTLVIVAPDMSSVPDFKVANVSLTFKVDNSSTSVKLGARNSVAAGTGCLEVNGGGGSFYLSKQCGIVISEKATTTVALAGLKLDWDPAVLDVDFGPHPAFQLSSKDANRYLAATIDPWAVPPKSAALLIPSMAVDLALSHPSTGVLHGEKIQLAENSLKVQSIQPADIRATVHLAFVHGAPKFPLANSTKGNLAVVYLKSVMGYATGNAQLIPQIRLSSGRGGYYNGGTFGDYAFNYYRIAENGVDQKLRAFPLLPGIKDSYAVSINEHTTPLTLTKGQVQRVPVATVNVNHYKSNLPGTFEIFSDRIKKGDLQKVLLPGSFDSYYANLAQTATQNSLFLPYGYKYRLDFYIKDDLGRVTLQEQIPVDLTNE